MIKPSFFAALAACALFIAGLLITPVAQAADDVTLPDTLRVNGLVITGKPSLIEEQKSDLSLLTSVQFGSSPLIVKGKKIVKSNKPILPKSSNKAKVIAVYPKISKESLVALPTLVTPTPMKPTVAPTEVPLPTNTPMPTTAPSPAVQGGLSADRLFEMANNHRKSIGLNELQKDERACAVAQSRAPEIAGEIASGNMHAGIRARNLPYWNSENIITMGTEEGAFNWWINDQIHKEAIEGNYTYSCVACSGYACVQEFTNFQSK